ncbi:MULTISPECIES: ABC transporter permease [Clostridium]|uniref:ABC transporter permease n=1 Tax=Clostridium cibarium TaxID=2762247 RepID=A0ABR8PRX6_9CLOT|nr:MULTISPECIES: ABC transporter permease [Clostridium]MBD7910918.1 ABC transporter permease [Clostridium cibarium]
MRRLKLITKYFMKNALESNFGNKNMKPWLSVLLMLFVVGCISSPLALMVSVSYKPLEAMGQEGFLLTTILILGTLVTFVFGINTILNVFYFSNDVEHILPLPFKSSHIVFGKFLAALLDMYFYSLILLFPLIAYGIASNAGVVYYIYVLLSILVIPILPMIIGALICMLLMRFTSLSKHKDAFRMFAGTLMLVLFVAFNFFSQSSGSNDEVLVKLAAEQGNNSLMNGISNVLITNKLASYGLLYNKELRGLLFILAAIVIAAALFGVYYIIGGSLYYKGIIGASETYSKRENVLETKNADKLIRANSPIKALVLKDIKLLFRTPQFFINCIAMMFYMPAIFGLAFFAKGSDYLGEKLVGKENLYGYVIVAILVFSIMSILSGGAASTAISREGKDLIVSQYIPVSGKDFIMSKIISSILINEISAIIVIALMIFLKLPVIIIALGSVISLGSVAVISLVELYLDYKSPKLEWENERDMFKKNYMPLVLMLTALVLGGIFLLLTFVLKSYLITFLAMVIVIVVVGVVVLNMLNKACKDSII